MPHWRFVAETKRLMEIATDARALIGKCVLDLGCGSEDTADRRDWFTRLWNQIFDPDELTRFEPWYCRVAQEAGAEVLGIDIAANKGEVFRSMPLDLMNAETLDCLETESFDAANNMCFTVPPESRRAESGTSPAVMYKLRMDHKAAFDLNHEIFKQVERILKNGGIYTLSEFVYKKKRGRLNKHHVIEGLGG